MTRALFLLLALASFGLHAQVKPAQDKPSFDTKIKPAIGNGSASGTPGPVMHPGETTPSTDKAQRIIEAQDKTIKALERQLEMLKATCPKP